MAQTTSPPQRALPAETAADVAQLREDRATLIEWARRVLAATGYPEVWRDADDDALIRAMRRWLDNRPQGVAA